MKNDRKLRFFEFIKFLKYFQKTIDIVTMLRYTMTVTMLRIAEGEEKT